MKKRRVISGLLVFVFCLCQCLTVFASDEPEIDVDNELEIDIDDSFDVDADESFEIDSAGNVFRSGNDVAFSLEKFFTVISMGRTVNINETEVGGGVFAMAKDITITDSNINESAFLMAESITLRDTPVNGNVFAMGRKVDIAGESNAVYALGETVIFDGSTKALNVEGGSVSIGGKIDGDVSVEADSVVFDSDLEVTGNLKVTSVEEPAIPESVKTGSYEFEKKLTNKEKADPSDAVKKVTFGIVAKKIAKTIYLIIAITLLGMLLNVFFADQLKNAAENLKKPGPALLRGLLGFICIPFAGFFMCITIILAPAGGLLLLVYFVLLCAALCFTGASIGRVIFPKMHPFASAAICIAVLEVVRQLPIAGRIIGVICDIYLISYVLGVLFENYKRNRKKQPVVTAEVKETSVIVAPQAAKTPEVTKVTETTETTETPVVTETTQTAEATQAPEVTGTVITVEPVTDIASSNESEANDTPAEDNSAVNGSAGAVVPGNFDEKTEE